MITLDQYYMGRDKQYPLDLTTDRRANAARTVAAVNQLLGLYAAAGGDLSPHTVSSGWRPPAVNARTQGAAKRSNHMECRACDLHDPQGKLDAWCMNNLQLLEECRLWLEHPDATPGWCHLQIVPPASGNRVFHP